MWWERVPKGRASGSKIDLEILPYLTGAINSCIMMLTIAEVTGRTRRGHTACFTYFQKHLVFHPSMYFNFTPAGRWVLGAQCSNHIKSHLVLIGIIRCCQPCKRHSSHNDKVICSNPDVTWRSPRQEHMRKWMWSLNEGDTCDKIVEINQGEHKQCTDIPPSIRAMHHFDGSSGVK